MKTWALGGYHSSLCDERVFFFFTFAVGYTVKLVVVVLVPSLRW